MQVQHSACDSPSSISTGRWKLLHKGKHKAAQSVHERCSHVSSKAAGKACVLLDGLNRGSPKLGLGKTSKVDEHMAQQSKASPDTAQAPSSSNSVHHTPVFWRVYVTKISNIFSCSLYQGLIKSSRHNSCDLFSYDLVHFCNAHKEGNRKTILVKSDWVH